MWKRDDAFGEELPGVSPGSASSESAASGGPDSDRLDRQEFVLERQLGAVRELKAEARQLVQLQTGVFAGFATALGVIQTELVPGGFLPPTGVVESIGLAAIVVSGAAFLSVFLLVPRPLTDKEPLIATLRPFQPTREFRLPKPGTDATACIRLNAALIDRTEWRLQQIQRLNVVGVLAFLLWLGAQLLA